MDTTFILIGVFIFLVFVLLVFFLLTNLKKENFVANDGSIFTSQYDLDLYHDLIIKTQPLFEPDETNSKSKTILGYDKIFIANLKNDGFKDLKTLVKYRNQFKALSALINP